MIHHEFRPGERVLCIRPDAKLTPGDFKALAAVVDPVIEKRGDLAGLLIEVPTFPGWDSFEAFFSHMRFVRDHHKKIRRVALVSDIRLAEHAPKLAKHFLAAEVRHFAADDRDAALSWLESPSG